MMTTGPLGIGTGSLRRGETKKKVQRRGGKTKETTRCIRQK